MPIIIDNFHVETALPIDNRFVVGGVDSFYQDKNNIQNKYLGLRIWDLNDDIPYCWKGDVEGWVSENSVGVLADTSNTLGAESNYIPKFTSGPTVIGKSIIYQSPSTNQIGIGLIGTAIEANIPSGSNEPNSLHVAGNIRTNNHFIGKGLYVTDINASNINTGLLRIEHISPAQVSISSIAPVLANTDYALFNRNGTVSWRNTTTLSVLNSTNTTNVNVISDTTSTPTHFVTFVQDPNGLNPVPIKYNSSKMQFKPSNGQLFLSDGSASEPVYSFLNSTNTGIYHSNSNGVSTSVQGNEIISVRQYGLVTNNRIYIPTTSNNTDVGYGIVWLANGPSNDININDGFVYNGQRLNFYGIGSHIPDNTNTLSTLLTGRGTYIAGYFGVDIFSGGRLKLKVDEYNDVTINSRLNIYNSETLGNSINTNIVLSTIQNPGGPAGNNVVIKDWSVRASQALTPNSGSQDSWLTWKHHNGITIDGVYNTPNGPAKISGPDSPTYGTLTFWERHPYLHEQYLGSADRKTLTINSSVNNTGGLTSFVKVNGNIYNVTGNPFIGTYSVVSTKTLEDVLNNNLPKTIKTGMFDINGTSMYTTTPNNNGKFTIIPIADNDFANYTKWIEIPYNAPELTNVPANQTSYIGTGGGVESLNNPYNGQTLSGVTTVTGRARFDTYGTRNSLQQGWHNIKGYKVFQIQQRGSDDSRVKIVMYQDPAYSADFNSGRLTEWKLEKNTTGVSVAYGGIGNGSRYDFLQICPSFRPIPTYFMNQPGMSHVEIYIHEPAGEYQDHALYINLQRRSVLVPTTLNTNLPGIPLGSYTGI
jgi:hypothetical protein